MSASEPGSERVTQLLRAAEAGDGSATGKLLPLVYEELRAAARQLVNTRGEAVQPTGLVHDAYVRLARYTGQWEGRKHFLCVAAKAMRQILSDRARDLRAEKRGGRWQRITLQEESASGPGPTFDAVDLLALDDALSELSQADERAATVVEMRYLAGMTIEEVAEALDVSPTTVKDNWRAARAWLQRRLASSKD